MAAQDRGPGEGAPPSGADRASDADLARRLDTLSRDLASETRERKAAEGPSRSANAGYAVAVRLASEFVAAVLVGAALGWGLDKLAGTSPWGLIGLLLLGFVAGVMNVMRAAGSVSRPGSGRNGGTS
jgi:ATP synthase protein I